MTNRVHLNIYVPGGVIDPDDYFWTLFKYDVGRIADEFEACETIRAVDAWRIAKAFGKAAENGFDLSPSKMRYLLILSVNDCYWGGPDGMWEQLFDDSDVELSYAVKPMLPEVSNAA